MIFTDCVILYQACMTVTNFLLLDIRFFLCPHLGGGFIFVYRLIVSQYKIPQVKYIQRCTQFKMLKHIVKRSSKNIKSVYTSTSTNLFE